MSAEKSFGRFYLERIALSEGCGCAEKFIGTRGIDPQAPGDPAGRLQSPLNPALIFRLLRMFLRRRNETDR
jgi:hypothetical protein